MGHHTPHISDDELLMALDGELDAKRQGKVDAHLAACWKCRSRQASYRDAIDSFMGAHCDSAVPPADGPRALVRANIAQLHRAPAHWMPKVLPAAVVCASVLIAAALWTSLGGNLTAAVPNPDYTPGLTMPMNVAEVCLLPRENEHPAIPPSLAKAVFGRYGIEAPKPRAYEIDYLITPALGGAVDARNLWPQPYRDGIWNSGVKDALEEHLRGLVCSGDVSLKQAQAELAGDWVRAYRKYFRTSKPLAAHAKYAKDQPWE